MLNANPNSCGNQMQTMRQVCDPKGKPKKNMQKICKKYAGKWKRERKKGITGHKIIKTKRKKKERRKY